MNIPSNFSLEEVVKYAEMPEEVRVSLSSIFNTIGELQRRITQFEKHEEILEEQLYFRDEFIRSIVERCKYATKCKELVKDILLELDNSYIEL